jgi:hypothetical protein
MPLDLVCDRKVFMVFFIKKRVSRKSDIPVACLALKEKDENTLLPSLSPDGRMLYYLMMNGLSDVGEMRSRIILPGRSNNVLSTPFLWKGRGVKFIKLPLSEEWCINFKF